MEHMIAPTEANSTMYSDFAARRPMEIETYLGSPIKLAQEAGVPVPRIETLYSLLHNANIMNQNRPQQVPAAEPGAQAPPRMSSGPNGPMPRGFPPGAGPGPMPGPMRNGMRPGPGSRAPSAQGGPPPPGRRGPSMGGYPPRMNGNGYGPRGPPQQMQRRPSMEGDDMAEFSHLMLYDNIPEGQLAEPGYDGMTPSSSGDFALREREMALRQKELALREREFHMRRGPRMPPPPASHAGYDEDEEDGEDYFDPMAPQAGPPVDPESLDMMSVTSRRTRKAPSASQLRNNPEMMGGGPPRQSRGFRRPPMKNRASTTIMNEMPNLRDQLMSNPLMGYSSDRYGNVDRMNMGHESRTNSLTAERLNELQRGGPAPYGNGPPMSRRGSQSPGHPLGPPGPRPNMRPSPPNGYGPPHGMMPPPGPMMSPNGRPSPPGMRQPVPRHPPGHGNAVAPHEVEQQVGVSNLYPPKSGPQVRSLTGSASASAGSGDSNRSAPLDSDPSAHSSSSSLGPRAPIGVR